KKAFLFCPDGVVSALKQPFFSKNSKKDKHQNDVCLQSGTSFRKNISDKCVILLNSPFLVRTIGVTEE
ncbi:hypothetical protein, partial [Streptococcus suis]|uniref:hypothetical protein n=1 Tax=Streptococcus suis TaxID=1307 RepID=UPI003AF77548